jgi:hypothetical protein
MQTLLPATTALALVAAANLSPATAQAPKPSGFASGTLKTQEVSNQSGARVSLRASSRGLVYVETNNSTPGRNAVLAFSRDRFGRLKELPGSPFATNGTGVRDLTFALGPFANDQPVIANPEHTLLFAVNEGSNSIAVFYIGGDGALTPVSGSPFPSGGFQPVSLSLLGNVLAVVNKNQDPAQASAEAAAQPNYTTFRVSDDGRLSPIANSTITATASPSQALSVVLEDSLIESRFGAGEDEDDSGVVFGADFEGGNLQSFELGRNGVLQQNPPQPLPSAPFVGQTFQGGPAPALPLGLGVYPELPILYVGFVTINEIGVYSFSREGTLKFVRTVSNPSQGGNCWIVINPDGTRMYAMDTGTNQITVYDVAIDPLTPRALAVTQLAGTGRGFELALSDDGRFLQAISQQGDAAGSVADNTLHVLRVGSNGLLTEVETDSLTQFVPNPPARTRWMGVVAF